MKRLHIGCGPIKMEGYINLDIEQAHNPDIVADVRTINFDEQSMNIIYSCHCIEHLRIKEAAWCFKNFYKWLVPSGVLRLAVPSLELAINAYTNGSDMKFLYGAEFRGYYVYDTPCERFNFFMKEWEHKCIYDYNQLQLMLTEAGFTNIQRKQANESAIPGFSHDRFISESLYVEAIK